MTQVIVESLIGSTLVRVLAVEHAPPANWAPAGLLSVPERRRLDVHYRSGSRSPRVGDVLDTWLDVSTTYAMAPTDAPTIAEINARQSARLKVTQDKLRAGR